MTLLDFACLSQPGFAQDIAWQGARSLPALLHELAWQSQHGFEQDIKLPRALSFPVSTVDTRRCWGGWQRLFFAFQIRALAQQKGGFHRATADRRSPKVKGLFREPAEAARA